MALVEQGTCKITHLTPSGLGVGKTEGGVVEVPYALPGEEISFDRHVYRRESNCVLREVLVASPERQTPPCPYFGACGGCLLQHLKPDAYAAVKVRLLQAVLDKNQLTPYVHPLVTVAPGQRRRAQVEGVKKNGQMFLGFRRYHAHQIINIDLCPVSLPALSQVILPLRETLQAVLEDRQKIRVSLLVAANGLELQLFVQGALEMTEERRTRLCELALSHNIIRLSVRVGKTIYRIRDEAEPYVLFDGCPVPVDSECFLQPTEASDTLLPELVLKMLGPIPSGSQMIDFFCGRGTYTLPLSRQGAVLGIESDKRALPVLESVARAAGRPISLLLRDLFTEPLCAAEMGEATLAVINPPRAGAEAQCRAFARSPIQRLCYVSCNPETFGRDAALLRDAGYRLTDVTPVDQFYWSPHLEIVAQFEKGRS